MISVNSPVLLALAQPCLGAFIGYLTNKIAIRMLFRPLRPWYVLGRRLPLTPGIIPSRRHELAASIGDMVDRRLLTSEEIGRALSREGFQEHLGDLIARRLDSFFQEDLPAPGAIFPLEGTVFQALQAGLGRELEEAICRFLAGGQAEEYLARWLQAAEDQSGAGEGAALRRLGRFLLELLLNGSEARMAAALRQMLSQAGAAGRSLRDCLPEALVLRLHALIDKQTPLILERVGRQLLSAELRPTLLAALLGAVHQLLESLGPMGAMARGFFEEDTFSRRINDYLNTHSDKISAWLAGPELRQGASRVLRESADTLLDRPVAELLATMEPAQVDALCAVLGERFVAALQSEAVAEPLALALGEMLQGVLAAASEGRQGLGSALVQSPQGRAFVGAAVAAFVEKLLTRPLGRLDAWLPKAVQSLMATHLLHVVNRFFLQELPGVMQALNLRELVKDKVDSLDLLQLERLLLDIMEEQFRYINLFGALLGFLIGLVNLLFFRLA